MATISPAQRADIVHLYSALFNRAPDASGLNFWAQAYADGASLAAIAQSFLASTEGRAIYPASQSASQFVAGFYQAVFGRVADAGGLAFWAAALDVAGGAGSDTARAALVGQLVGVVSQTLDARPEGITDADYAQTVADRALFANKTTVGDYVAALNINDVNLARQTLALVSADPASVPIAKAFAASGGATPAPSDPGLTLTNADAYADIVAKLAAYGGTHATVDATGMDITKLQAVADGIAKIASRGVGGELALSLADYDGTLPGDLAGKFSSAATLKVAGSSGDDDITLKAFARASTVIDAGDGDDVFHATVDGVNAANTTLSARHTLQGGQGTDTLVLTVTGVVAAALQGATLTGIERVALDVSDDSSARFAALAGVTEVVVTGGGSVTVDALGSGASLILDATADTGSHTAHYAAGSTAQLVLRDGAFADVVTVDGPSLNSIDVTQTGDAAVLNSLVLGSTISTLTYVGDGGTAITHLSGGVANGLSLTVTSADAFVLQGITAVGVNVDGSASTGTLALTFEQAAGTVKGGSNGDLLMVFDTATLTGNGGADVFVMRAGVGQTEVITQASLLAKMVTITDFSDNNILGVEATVNLAADPSATPVRGSLQEVSVSGGDLLAATMDAAVQLRALGADVPYVGFVYNADTYILVDNQLDGLGAGDMLIRLTGSPDLSRVSYENDGLIMSPPL